MKTWKFDIPYDEDLYPCNLAFVFVDGKFYARMAVTRPHRRGDAGSFPFAVRVDAKEVVMYIALGRYEGVWVSEPLHLAAEKDPNLAEIRQDLEAIGYKPGIDHPELEGLL